MSSNHPYPSGSPRASVITLAFGFLWRYLLGTVPRRTARRPPIDGPRSWSRLWGMGPAASGSERPLRVALSPSRETAGLSHKSGERSFGQACDQSSSILPLSRNGVYGKNSARGVAPYSAMLAVALCKLEGQERCEAFSFKMPMLF